MTADYEAIVDTDPKFLHEASQAWKSMGNKFRDLHTNYRDDVKKVAESHWQGLSATMYKIKSQTTLEEYAGARDEAWAVSSLLDEAYTTLKKQRKHVLDVRDKAEEAGMSVDSSGHCTLHLDKLDDDKADTYRHDRPAREKAVKDWNDRIDKAVKAFQDADSNLMRALKAGPSDDGKGIKDGFNGALKGDAGAANADRAEKLYNRAEKGKKLSPEQTRELSFLMRENEGDPEFSRTLLNSMGPDGVIKTSNALDNQAYYDDTDHKKRYLGLQKHLANSLATATTADGANQPGSASVFASQWREKLRQDGLEKYDLTLSEKTGRDPDQKVRGYQTMVTLMRHSDEKYSSIYLEGLADDIRAAEDPGKGGNRDAWDLEGDFSGDKEKRSGLFDHGGSGRFANDPYDGILDVMSKNPEAATDYFDPDTSQGKDRLEYLRDERDWKLVDTTDSQVSPGGNVQITHGPDEEGKDVRSGFGAALEAAATGHAPGTDVPDDFTKHTDAQKRVFQEVVTSYADITKTDQTAMPENIRQNMANTVAYYPDDVHDILGMRGLDQTDDNGLTVERGDMVRFLRGASEDGGAFRTIHDSQMAAVAGQVHGLDHDDFTQGAPGRSSDHARGVMQESGKVMGSLDRIRADVLADDRDGEIDRNNWNKIYKYHLIAAPLAAVPYVGADAVRLVDIGTGHEAADLNADVKGRTREELLDRYTHEGYPRLEDMVQERARQVGVGDGETGHGSRYQDLLNQAEGSYGTGITDAEGYTGENA